MLPSSGSFTILNHIQIIPIANFSSNNGIQLFLFC